LSLFDLLSSLSANFSDHLKEYYDPSNSILYKKFSENFHLTKPIDQISSKWISKV